MCTYSFSSKSNHTRLRQTHAVFPQTPCTRLDPRKPNDSILYQLSDPRNKLVMQENLKALKGNPLCDLIKNKLL